MAHPHRPEDLLEFPCDFMFKAFGPNDDTFPEAARAAVSEIIPTPLDSMRVRTSRQGSYVCVSILAHLQSASQLEAVYHSLRQVPNLRFLL